MIWFEFWMQIAVLVTVVMIAIFMNDNNNTPRH